MLRGEEGHHAPTGVQAGRLPSGRCLRMWAVPHEVRATIVMPKEFLMPQEQLPGHAGSRLEEKALITPPTGVRAG